MTWRHARLILILCGLAMAAWLLAGCDRRTPPVAINTPVPITIPTAGAAGEVAAPTLAPAAETTTPQPTQSSQLVAATAIPTVEATVVQPTQPPAPTAVPTVLASNERIVVIGSEMVSCPGEGAGGGKCYRVKEGDATEWTVFPGRIEGFEPWPGADSVMLIREDKIANPPPGGANVMWTVLKGLYRIAASETPTVAP